MNLDNTDQPKRDNYRRNVVLSLGAIVAGIAGIIGYSSTRDHKPSGVNPQTAYFTNWGKVDKLTKGAYDSIEMHLGDMDGDGDLDIVIANKTSGIYIYENRIPQVK